ncbi:MAG: hypothetical protein RBQ97_00560 [Acholeplasma sp.]|nr:hypothetical protein [Acholeplasma sp.]
MQKQDRKTMIILAFLMLAVSLVTVVFAWFSLVEKTQIIIIKAGDFSARVKLYQVMEPDNEEINEINISNVVPGDEFNYLLTVKNMGIITANLTVSFTFLDSEYNSIKFRNYFTLSYSFDGENYSEANISNDLVLLNQESIIASGEKNVYFRIDVNTNLTKEVYTDGAYFAINSIVVLLQQGE